MRRAAARETDEGDGRYDAGGEKERADSGPNVSGPYGGALLACVYKEEQGGYQEECHLEGEELHAAQVDLLSDQAVEAEGAGE